MTITKNQIRTIYLWLALVAILAIFPPMLGSKTNGATGTGAFTFSGSIHHGFVLSGGSNPVNLPSVPGSRTDANEISCFITKEISGAAMLCEMICITGLCGMMFVHSRTKG
jgi:hypothetical protein